MSNPADPVNADRVRWLRARYPLYTAQDIAALTGWELSEVIAAFGAEPQPGKTLPIYRSKEVTG